MTDRERLLEAVDQAEQTSRAMASLATYWMLEGPDCASERAAQHARTAGHYALTAMAIRDVVSALWNADASEA